MSDIGSQIKPKKCINPCNGCKKHILEGSRVWIPKKGIIYCEGCMNPWSRVPIKEKTEKDS